MQFSDNETTEKLHNLCFEEIWGVYSLVEVVVQEFEQSVECFVENDLRTCKVDSDESLSVVAVHGSSIEKHLGLLNQSVLKLLGAHAESFA